MEKSDVLKCEICFLLFSATKLDQRPTLVKCGHTFCQKCVSGFKGKCPKCRKEFDPELCVPNFTLLGLLEHLSEGSLPEIIAEKPAHSEPAKQKPANTKLESPERAFAKPANQDPSHLGVEYPESPAENDQYVKPFPYLK